jgi:hypothetical protein
VGEFSKIEWTTHTFNPWMKGDTLAMKLWRDRERTFPAFTRRWNWDAIDHASGAVDRIRAEAAKQRKITNRDLKSGREL